MEPSYQKMSQISFRLDLPEGRIEGQIELPQDQMRFSSGGWRIQNDGVGAGSRRVRAAEGEDCR